MKENNKKYLTDSNVSCLFCRFVDLGEKQKDMKCTKTGEPTNKYYTCDLWRYGF